MAQFSCLVTVRDGKMKLLDRDEFDRGCRQFMDGEEVELSLESVGAKHTTAQQRFFHGPVLKAFAALGYHKQEAKDMLALMFIPDEVRQMDGTVVRVPGHTSKLKKDEYTAFIEQCIQLAAENEQYVEDSDEWLKKNRKAA